MFYLKVKDIIENCNGKLVCGNVETECVDFCTDTRKIKKDDVYVGLKGEKFDGSQFYKNALEQGAKVCVLQNVEIEESVISEYKDRAIVLVDDTLKALQKMAEIKRSKYDIPVIAITGSVGKTSTKDMVASVVAEQFKVLKTEGNFNNHIGLPLTILRLKDENALVVEMGMSHLGEISLLTSIAKPTIAIITNVGTAHIGNLGSRENILKAKLEILEGLQENGVLIINNDNDMLNAWAINEKNRKIIKFGVENESDFNAKNIEINSNKIECECVGTICDKNVKNNNIDNCKNTNCMLDVDKKNNDENLFKLEIPIVSKPFVYNSLCAVSVGKYLNIENEKICNGIKNFELTKNRMEIIKNGEITIVNDCYNANFDSMKASIESLAKMNGKRKIAILGDMLELGEFSEKLHYDIGKVVVDNKIDVVITVGNESKNIAKAIEDSRACSHDNDSENIAKIESMDNEKNNAKANNIEDAENIVKIDSMKDVKNSAQTKSIDNVERCVLKQGVTIHVFDDNSSAIECINKIKNEGDVILIKASNGMHFAEIVDSLR